MANAIELAVLDSANNSQTINTLGVLGAVDEATLSTVASGTSSQTALEANEDRNGVFFQNTDANACYLKYGTTATTTSFTKKITSGEFWVMPAPIYLGQIDVIWDGDGSGSLFITEL